MNSGKRWPYYFWMWIVVIVLFTLTEKFCHAQTFESTAPANAVQTPEQKQIMDILMPKPPISPMGKSLFDPNYVCRLSKKTLTCGGHRAYDNNLNHGADKPIKKGL